MSQNKLDILWIVPEKKGGIASYSKRLFQSLFDKNTLSPTPTEVRGHYFEFQTLAKGAAGFEDFVTAWDDFFQNHPLDLNTLGIIHIQHEYGLFGGKIPFQYWFPKVIPFLRRLFPNAKIVMTAHTVLEPHFRYPLKNRGVRTPLYFASNLTWVPYARSLWGKGTFGYVDQVIVHSHLQIPSVRAQGTHAVAEIPHFVPTRNVSRLTTPLSSGPTPEREEQKIWKLTTFGFFSKDKGQDLVILAAHYLKEAGVPFQLTLAGGVRIEKDQKYFQSCAELIRTLKLGDFITITGFVPFEEIPRLFKDSDLVIAPFRETTGSGSLAEALAESCALLASNHPLNLEIAERVPKALRFFERNNAKSLAQAIQEFIALPDQEKVSHRQAASRYAEVFSLPKISEKHRGLYFRLTPSVFQNESQPVL